MGQPLTRRLHRGRSPASPTSMGVPLHVDGARLWNAVVALGTRPRRRCWPTPTAPPSASPRASACPVGSVVVGSAGLHRARTSRPQARRWRHAPGRRRSPRPGLVALQRRAGGHDRATRRGPRERPAPGRGPGRDWTASSDSTRRGVTTNYIVFGLRPRPGQDPLEARARLHGRDAVARAGLHRATPVAASAP